MADGMPVQTEVKGVHRAIHAVMKACNEKGLGKTHRNKHQGYDFRSVDDIYALIGSLLVENDLIITPHLRDIKSDIQPTTNGQGKPQLTNYVILTVDYHFVCIVDGSTHLVSAPGEAFDTGDKATNKAMSAAYKYMAFQAFHIPVQGQGTPDSDQDTYERAPTRRPDPRTPVDRAKPDPAPLTKANARPEYKAMVDEICAFRSEVGLKQWGARNVDRVNLLPADWKAELRKEYAAKLDELKREVDADNGPRFYDEIPM